MAAFKQGDLVRWKREYVQDESEMGQVFVAVEPADDGRCYIRPALWDYERDGLVCPTQMVRMSMLERV